MRCRGTVVIGHLCVALSGLAAAACDTVDLGKPPAGLNACRPSVQFFVDRVWPEFLGKDYGGKRCGDTRCHDASSARPLLLPAPRSAAAVPLPPDWEAVYRSAADQLQCTNIAGSALIVRPSSLDHGGGRLIDAGGAEAALVRMWVEAQP